MTFQSAIVDHRVNPIAPVEVSEKNLNKTYLKNRAAYPCWQKKGKIGPKN